MHWFKVGLYIILQKYNYPSNTSTISGRIYPYLSNSRSSLPVSDTGNFVSIQQETTTADELSVPDAPLETDETIDESDMEALITAPTSFAVTRQSGKNDSQFPILHDVSSRLHPM